MKKISSENFFTVEEAAEYIGVSKSTMYNYVRSGKLTAFKFGACKSGKWKIPAKQLRNLAMENGGLGLNSGNFN